MLKFLSAIETTLFEHHHSIFCLAFGMDRKLQRPHFMRSLDLRLIQLTEGHISKCYHGIFSFFKVLLKSSLILRVDI